jgi:hypothetical protein
VTSRRSADRERFDDLPILYEFAKQGVNSSYTFAGCVAFRTAFIGVSLLKLPALLCGRYRAHAILRIDRRFNHLPTKIENLRVDGANLFRVWRFFHIEIKELSSRVDDVALQGPVVFAQCGLDTAHLLALLDARPPSTWPPIMP